MLYLFYEWWNDFLGNIFVAQILDEEGLIFAFSGRRHAPVKHCPLVHEDIKIAMENVESPTPTHKVIHPYKKSFFQ